MPFFAESELLKKSKTKRLTTGARCNICRLYKNCNSPKMSPTGKGKRKFLIVGEAPGKNEDNEGYPFVGKSGKLLRKTLSKIGIDLDRDCVRTNAIICRPEKNRTPTDEEIAYCNPNLQKTIEEEDSIAIVTLGKPALQAVLAGIWTEAFGSMGMWAGWKIPCQEINRWIIPTYHPSYVMRETNDAKRGTPIDQIFKRHLSQLDSITDRPYDSHPDWESSIEPLYDEGEIVHRIAKYIHKGGAAAFDFETDRLKPHHPESTLTSCSICWQGKETIAFPWTGKNVKKVFQEFLMSDVIKFAHNLKMEHSWVLGKIRRWGWDTVVNAHILDNRTGETNNLEFQGFIRLGVTPYSSHISPFLKAKFSYTKNRIREVDMHNLLVYNGMDSLVCYHLAVLQRKLFGMTSWKDWLA